MKRGDTFPLLPGVAPSDLRKRRPLLSNRTTITSAISPALAQKRALRPLATPLNSRPRLAFPDPEFGKTPGLEVSSCCGRNGGPGWGLPIRPGIKKPRAVCMPPWRFENRRELSRRQELIRSQIHLKGRNGAPGPWPGSATLDAKLSDRRRKEGREMRVQGTRKEAFESHGSWSEPWAKLKRRVSSR